jgi:hypothetical protein
VNSATVAFAPAAAVDAVEGECPMAYYSRLGRATRRTAVPGCYCPVDPSTEGRRQIPALPPLFSHNAIWPTTIVLSVDLHMS